MSKLTPMMQQYLEIKEQYPDTILFFRLGDFYEMFFTDAEIASRDLEITLTSREGGVGGRIPMCGVPCHAAEGYLAKLVSKGHRVAICEQVEDPKEAKGIVKRDVVRVVTPGTANLTTLLNDKENSYIVAIYHQDHEFGFAGADVTTGQFFCTALQGPGALALLRDELNRLGPAEAVVAEGDQNPVLQLLETMGVRASFTSPNQQDKSQAITELEAHFGKDASRQLSTATLSAVVALLAYIKSTQKISLGHINRLSPYQIGDQMILDSTTRRNLELVQNMRDHNRKGSLLAIMDKTVTAMGGRLLRQWVLQPLIQHHKIEERLDAVEELKDKALLRQELSDSVGKIYDLERLMGRVAYGTANARDLLALKRSLDELPTIKELIHQLDTSLLRKIAAQLPELSSLAQEIDQAIHEEPPVSLREGGLIRSGYNAEVDHLRRAASDGRQWIATLEQSERERTGIKSLKVGYNKVFGYYLEITKSNLSSAPTDYIRKQTLANAERYITPELKEMESTILGAHDRVIELEYQLFLALRSRVAEYYTTQIQQMAWGVAHLDCLISLAEIAIAHRYTRPTIQIAGKIIIKDGRHPVVERTMKDSPYVPNDLYVDNHDNRVLIITGPNMAGKSTYLRMSALIVLMAQMGSFVPASSAQIGVVDRIFTRVGAGDDLAGGQSTFMVEMAELSHILANATSQSFLVLDEIGRGTSTFDGMSIARAVIEYIHNLKHLGAKTLFATHYHELTDLEELLSGVKNYSVAVKERGDDVIFLHRIIPGGVDKSYGIAVAKLAGLPKSIITRAKEILSILEDGQATMPAKEIAVAKQPVVNQLPLLETIDHPLIKELSSLDVTTLTPIEALNTLYQLQQKAQGKR